MDSTHPPSGQHLATISHDGRFWDVYLEFQEDVRRPEVYRAALAYSAADGSTGTAPLRTTPVVIETTYEEAVRRARGLEDHQLVAFLRSILP